MNVIVPTPPPPRLWGYKEDCRIPWYTNEIENKFNKTDPFFGQVSITCNGQSQQHVVGMVTVSSVTTADWIAQIMGPLHQARR